jgi:hypothetical protein
MAEASPLKQFIHPPFERVIFMLKVNSNKKLKRQLIDKEIFFMMFCPISQNARKNQSLILMRSDAPHYYRLRLNELLSQ